MWVYLNIMSYPEMLVIYSAENISKYVNPSSFQYEKQWFSMA